MGEIADWMIEQMFDIDPEVFQRRDFRVKVSFDTLPFEEQRELWKWKTKDNKVYKLSKLTDRHIANIIPYMERRKTEQELPDEQLRLAWIQSCKKTIKLMKKEQRYRKQHHITIDDPPLMNIVHHKKESK